MLNRHLDRQCYTVAVDGGDLTILVDGDVTFLRIALDLAFAGRAGQQLVHLLFHAREAVPAVIDKPEHMRG